jgi:hypothetical protein
VKAKEQLWTLAGDNETPADAGASATVRPILMVDIDGVISLFGAPLPSQGASASVDDAPSGARSEPPPPSRGRFHSIDGIPHFLSATAAAHLLALSVAFDLVWASGWEEKADEYLPWLLGLPAGLPFLRFPRAVGRGNAHWKLAAIETYAGDRPLAWVDDALNEACRAWASARAAPTLLVRTEPRDGLTAREAELLREWARSLGG